MTVKRNGWNPSSETVQILEQGLKHVNSVPYNVSLRWVFYRLLQDGIYKNKNDYHTKFMTIFSNARHNNTCGWHPNTVEDDTRGIYWKGVGVETEEDAVDEIKCNFDKLRDQEHIVLLLYEARAMSKQFAYYTKHIPLIPMGGESSIPLRYETAYAVSRLSKRYNKPVVLLYFGDCDIKGRKIQKTAKTDITRWCKTSFIWKYCGLTEEQVIKYNVPENFEKPGYQWEALTDSQAKEIITGFIAKYHDPSLCEQYETLEEETVQRWKHKLREDL